MKPAVMCLPITIPTDIKPGLALTPFTVWMISRLLGISSVCSINMTGMKYAGLRQTDVMDRFQMFTKIMKRLGMRFDQYWLDNDPLYVGSLQAFCDRLVGEGQLQCKELDILTCHCGAVEVLEAAVSSQWAMNRKLIRESGGLLQCKLCNSTLRSEHDLALVTETGFGGNPISTFPNFYQKEIDTLQDDYNQAILVSRKRNRERKVLLFGREWLLDTDFCWAFVFYSLRQSGFDPAVAVISNRSLKPLVWSYGLSRKLDVEIRPVSVVITPFAKIRSSTSKSSLPENISALLDRYGSTPIRFLLGNCLRWDQKDLIVDSSVIFWTLKALEKVRDYPKIVTKATSISEALSMSDGNNIASFVTNVRKSEQIALTAYQQHLLKGD